MNIDELGMQIENSIFDDSMPFHCNDCGKIMGYMDNNQYRYGDEYNWTIRVNCFGKISTNNDKL